MKEMKPTKCQQTVIDLLEKKKTVYIIGNGNTGKTTALDMAVEKLGMNTLRIPINCTVETKDNIIYTRMDPLINCFIPECPYCTSDEKVTKCPDCSVPDHVQYNASDTLVIATEYHYTMKINVPWFIGITNDINGTLEHFSKEIISGEIPVLSKKNNFDFSKVQDKQRFIVYMTDEFKH